MLEKAVKQSKFTVLVKEKFQRLSFYQNLNYKPNRNAASK